MNKALGVRLIGTVQRANHIRVTTARLSVYFRMNDNSVSLLTENTMFSRLGDEVKEEGIEIRFVGVFEVITILLTFFKQTLWLCVV